MEKMKYEIGDIFYDKSRKRLQIVCKMGNDNLILVYPGFESFTKQHQWIDNKVYEYDIIL